MGFPRTARSPCSAASWSRAGGFDQMLAAAAAAVGRQAGSPLLFLFVGDGRLAPMLRENARDNVLWRPAMPRADYLQLLGACDVGMVATVPGVTSFSIPSKTLDYLRAGLPVVSAVEPGSDFSILLERHGVGARWRSGTRKGTSTPPRRSRRGRTSKPPPRPA